MTRPPTWVSEDQDPHGNAYWMAYREAQGLTDAQLTAARADVERSIAHAQRLLASAWGRGQGLADAQMERGGRKS